MKFVYGHISDTELAVGADINVTDMQEIEVPDNDPMAPHIFVPAGELCAICGRPEIARRHHYAS